MKIYDFMELYGSGELSLVPTVLTIGVFDGLHLGHRALMERTVEIARKEGIPNTAAITFSSNPKPGRTGNLDTMRIREDEVSKYGINSFVVIDFSEDFGKNSASGFLDMLCSMFTLRKVVVGDDFRFGHPSSSASASDLASMLLEKGIEDGVEIENAILTEGGEKISSTLLRRVIEKGETGCIPSLTGRKYRFDLMPCPFRVEEDALVMCTESNHQLLPPPGVYEADLKERSGILLPGVCEVTDESIVFRLTGREISFLTTHGSFGEVHPDSIFFGEKK